MLSLPLLGLALLAPAPRPNVVVVVTDDQGYGDLSCHGNPGVRTPRLDALAAESARFDRFFVSPLCAPTRASLLTGRYSLRTGVRGVAAGDEVMRSDEVTVAELLRGAGYRTGLFGKWHNGEHFPHDPRGQGFGEFFGTNLGHWNNYFDTTLRRNDRWEKAPGYIADAVTDRALDFVANSGAAPFLCVLSLPTPHSPFQCPDRFFDAAKARGLDDRLACVYGMCENIDANVGRLLDKLDSLGKRDDTVVVFLTDNGPNGARFNGGMRGVKGSDHEGGSRVPCFVRYPSRWPAGRAVAPIAAHIDLLPTLCELCGVAVPHADRLDGRSLVPLLDGKTSDWPARTLFTRHAVPTANRPGGAARTDRHRLVRGPKGWMLFDMASDPGETNDVAAANPEVVKRLTGAYDDWLRGALAELGPVPATEVGHAEENPVELSTPNSRFTGGPRYFGKHPNNNWLVDWSGAGAEAVWNVDVKRAGTYAVRLRYLLEGESPAEAAVGAGGASCAGALAPAAPKRVPSPDRVPRDEVPEMAWAHAPLGRLELPAGPARLVLRVRGPGAKGAHVQALALERE